MPVCVRAIGAVILQAAQYATELAPLARCGADCRGIRGASLIAIAEPPAGPVLASVCTGS